MTRKFNFDYQTELSADEDVTAMDLCETIFFEKDIEHSQSLNLGDEITTNQETVQTKKVSKFSELQKRNSKQVSNTLSECSEDDNIPSVTTIGETDAISKLDAILKKNKIEIKTKRVVGRRVEASEINHCIDLLLEYQGVLSPTSITWWDKYLLNDKAEALTGSRAVSVYRNHISKKNMIKGVSSDKLQKLKKRLSGIIIDDELDRGNEIEVEAVDNVETVTDLPKPTLSKEQMEQVIKHVNDTCNILFDRALEGNEICVNAIRTIMDMAAVKKSLNKHFVAKIQ